MTVRVRAVLLMIGGIVLSSAWIACGTRSRSPASDASPETTVGPCAAEVAPPGSGACPAACSGGCDAANVCTIDCRGAKACEGRAIECPADYACRVTCDGSDACDTAEVTCPARYSCTLICEGMDACGDAVLRCAEGRCEVQCGADAAACEGTAAECASGPCAATSAGSVAPAMNHCESSCSCSPVGSPGGEPEAPDAAVGHDAGADVTTGDEAVAEAATDHAPASDVVTDPAPEAEEAGACPACTGEHKGICTAAGAAMICTCDPGFRHDEAGACVQAPTYAEFVAWVAAYHAAHPGKDGDVVAKAPSQVAADPDAQKLLAICGADQRPVIPLLAWEYGGSDHPWKDPGASALVYCVFVPVALPSAHWKYDAAADRVTADVYLPFPAQNPCVGQAGAAQVTACLGDPSNVEILVDTANLGDGHAAGLDLSEASTELRLLPPDGGAPVLLASSI